MYLKTLEIIGFKSFANKTRLEFEPGMTAIVGPNGCGKSNVSDSLRWVLGEQSAKALRGSSMEDCIFNGTDDKKPLGMAEVSVTFADCEADLEIEYDEVTVTRRVFRSGEGQYFINKAPCRLKDIQRLFMGTGIGTTSYSLMEQGRIDRILSSRPEDRRLVFEEASGITKFKADKKEALRKLDSTEANLIRLADVIREVKRQIGSLQRQAGKARRYKEIKAELRQLDVFAAKSRLTETDGLIKNMLAEVQDLGEKQTGAQREVGEMSEDEKLLRESLLKTEREIGTVVEAGSGARSALEHTHEVIRINKQSMAEYEQWSERDTREIAALEIQTAERRQILSEHTEQADHARAEHAHAAESLKVSTSTFARHQAEIDAARSRIQTLREESVELESLASQIRNQLMEVEASERSTVMQRERLAAEKGQLQRTVTAFERRSVEMAEALEELKKAVTDCQEQLKQLQERRTVQTGALARLQQAVGDTRSRAAGVQATITMLSSQEESESDFPGGTRLLLDDANPLGLDSGTVVGTLASKLDVDPDYRTPLEVALRAWLDAVLVADKVSALKVLQLLGQHREGPARFLTMNAGPGADPVALPEASDRLLDHVRCPAEAEPAIRALIGHVVVVDSVADIPSAGPARVAYVTKDGAMAHGGGAMEFWMDASGVSNPLTRKHALAGARAELLETETILEQHRTTGEALTSEIQELDQSIAAANQELNQRNRMLAQKEGESQMVASEATEAQNRLETVTWELDSLMEQGESSDAQKQELTEKTEKTTRERDRISSEIATQTEELHVLERRHVDLQEEVTEHRVRFAETRQKAEHLTSQIQAVSSRLTELETALDGRRQGLDSYQTSTEKLAAAVAAAEGQLSELEAKVTSCQERANSLRTNREKQATELAAVERSLAEKRNTLEALREKRASLDVQCAEHRMRRQNMLDRVTAEHKITFEQILEEEDPEWPQGEPSLEEADTRVAELRTKMEAMGPVNLVAIEEYKELEERYAFLTSQEEDLIKSKQQLMDMIRKINHTTSEMFRSTFEQVDKNFMSIFTELFNGGTAKLVLVNEEDVLECGIEIIARPPGKRLQNVSLLSGGERTLTAVALLFAIYMIKPSPFCLLDELDAALDDTNINRFAKILEGFLVHSQFVVITHNRQTIGAADTIYGVTMPDKGVSRVVSMKFKDGQPTLDEGAAKTKPSAKNGVAAPA